jgi:lipoprotein-anchoring transpeptidase ErfK/SrfK
VTGAVFVAIQGEVQHRGRTYLRLVDGTYIAADAVKRLHPPPLHGVRLTKKNGLELPIAFVYRERTPLWRQAPGRPDAPPSRCGEAVRHSRFRVVRERRVNGVDYVEAPGGVLVARDAVRVARKSKRPYYVSSQTRWIHVDLSEQTLVAYLGTRPLLATLVSSGKEGRATPPGHYRIEWKHVSVTMTGEDDKTGGYEVAEVPWTLYYRSLYALHGAYWHQQFGQVRSHGCVNLPPADAYWLYHWTRPVLPAGWHSVRGKGTRLAITP